MNGLLHWSMLAILAATLSCKTADKSSIKDIGVVNSSNATTGVIYADEKGVYLKDCEPALAPPLTRTCESRKEPKYLDLSTYLYKLPYHVGDYQRDDQGLALVTKALQDANSAVAGGNQNAVSTVAKLTVIKTNLEKIVKISKDLGATQQDLTYYQYQEEFDKLLNPFMFSKSGGAGGSAHQAMTFVRVPKGSYNNSGSTHNSFGTVSISKDFFMQTTEVTQEQWYTVMGGNPSKFRTKIDCAHDYKHLGGVDLCPSHPVEQVSWTDVQLFIKKMNDKQDGNRYRLPTEAEWQYAATAGKPKNARYAGDLADVAWSRYDSGRRTHGVGKLRPNDFGLYDMLGNVWEWTGDWHGPIPPGNATDPVGPISGSERVTRGGSFLMAEISFDSYDSRSAESPESKDPAVGFRLVRISSP